jgi:hypothetical protein
MKPPDWSKANIELIREAVNGGDARLAAQVQLATSADQRATVLAGIYAAVATGIIAAMLTRESFENETWLVVASVGTVIAYLTGAILCIFATLPVKFWTAGNDPEAWYDDIEASKPLSVALGEQAEHHNAHILENNRTIARNAWLFRIGALLGIFAPVLGLIASGFGCLL